MLTSLRLNYIRVYKLITRGPLTGGGGGGGSEAHFQEGRQQRKHLPGGPLLHPVSITRFPHKIFARVWVAQEPICYIINAKTFQGLGPKRQKSCDGDRVY